MNNNEDSSIARLLAHARKLPDAIAFVILGDGEEPDNKISYETLCTAVKGLACQLSHMQLNDERVLLVYQDTLKFIISFLACQYAGIIPVPVSYVKGNKQFKRLNSIIDDAAASAILCKNYSVAHLQQGLGSSLALNNVKIISIDMGQQLDDAGITQKPTLHETAFIQYTSGSTGKPKGVIISHKNLNHNQLLIEKTFGCSKESVIFSWLPFHHDMGLIGNILHTIYVGCTCVLMSPFHFMQAPQRWLQNISKYRVTHSGGPNFAYDLCVNKIPSTELSTLDLSSWIVAYNGSEPIRSETIHRFSSYFKSAGFERNAFYPCYGLAEATLLVSGEKSDSHPLEIFIKEKLISNGKITLADKSDPQAQSIVSSGGIAAGIKLKIISSISRKECDEMQEGEICIAGESVAAGYWNKDNSGFFYDLDGELFLKTGDLGFIYKGALFVQGRLKEMLIIRGQNYYPYDIEEVASESHTAVEPNGVAVFGINNWEGHFAVVAEIKRTSLKNLDAENVIRSIDQKITGCFGVSPYDIVLTTPLSIPRTTSGKLQRIKCKDNYQCDELYSISSKLELSKKWTRKEKDHLLLEEVIKNEDHDSIKKYLINIIECKSGDLHLHLLEEKIELTDIGIDSLMAMELINTINKDLNIPLDASKVFQDNTLMGLNNIIESMMWLNHKHVFGKEITI